MSLSLLTEFGHTPFPYVKIQPSKFKHFLLIFLNFYLIYSVVWDFFYFGNEVKKKFEKFNEIILCVHGKFDGILRFVN